MTISMRLVAAAALLAALSGPASAQQSEQVQFEPGNYGTMLSGSITGHEYMDHKLRASKGQEMFVSLTVTDTNGHGSAYFNILPPGSDNVAIYNGSSEGRSTTMTLPDNGEYIIRVYLMGNDQDAGKTVSYNLDLSIQ